jgi:uncharacterized protein (TIGR02453 family)
VILGLNFAKIRIWLPLLKIIIMDFAELHLFLTELKSNNTKDWFDLHRKRYESLRKSWIEFIDALIAEIAKFEPDFGSLQAKDCIFRINKDIRFSKDKSPYKTNFGASINIGGKKEFVGGYYFHFAHDEIFCAGGIYMPSPEKLAAMRQEIDYNFDSFLSIVKDKEAVKRFKSLGGEKLSRPPKGYEAENPAIDFLKMKSFIWTENFSLKQFESKSILKDLSSSFLKMKPLNDFIRNCN